MKFEKLFLCKWVDLHEIQENESIAKGYTICLYDIIISNAGLIPVAFMIFIGKSETTGEYEVRVYKSKKSDKFIQRINEYIPRYTENDEYISFFFYCYYSAQKFADKDLPYHIEYNDRPIQPII